MSGYAPAQAGTTPVWSLAATDPAAVCRAEAQRARNYPFSRWYVRPLAGFVARYLAHSSVRPWQVTVGGFACTLGAVAVILLAPAQCTVAAGLVLAAWFCDRLDGQLARRQGSATAYGAWLDANLDELSDLALQTAFAAAAATQLGALAWWLWGGFVTGKYLFMYGLTAEHSAVPTVTETSSAPNLWKRLYHFPANADVRIHLAMAAAYTGAWGIELGAIAAYYQLRWLARYALLAARLREEGT